MSFRIANSAFLFLASLLWCTADIYAEAVTWTGAGGDHLWSNAQNWSDEGGEARLPTGSDRVILKAVNGDGVITNDLVNLSILRIVFAGDAPISFYGNEITLTQSHACSWYNTVLVTNYVPLKISTNPSTFDIYNSFTIMTNITFTGTGTYTFTQGKTNDASMCNWNIYGTVSAPNGNLGCNMANGINGRRLHFRGPVYAKSFTASGYGRCVPVFYAGGDVGTMSVFYQQIFAGAENGFPTNTVFSMIKHNETHAASTTYSINGFNQTIDRIEGGEMKSFTANHDQISDGNLGGVLTLRGTADAVTQARLINGISIVWDPVDDFTQVFSNRTSTMSGSITVKRGTFRIAGWAKFTRLPTVCVASNAVFDCASTNAAPLPALSDVTIGENGVFKFSGGTAVNCEAAHIRIDNGGSVYVADGGSITVKSVDYRGAHYNKGTYTASTCPWLTGGGSVTVLQENSSWLDPVDGNWSESAKWSAGVPISSALDTYVTCESQDYTVTLDTNRLSVGTVYIANDGEHISKLKLTGPAVVDGETRFEVYNGGMVYSDSGTLSITNGNDGAEFAHVIREGGVWNLTGNATNVFSSLANNSPFFKDGGKLDISGDAKALFYGKYTYTTPVYFRNGVLRLSDNGCFAFNPSQNGEGKPFRGVDILAKDNAVISIPRFCFSPDRICSTNKMKIEGSAVLETKTGFYAGVGASRGTRMEMDFDTASTIKLGEHVGIGTDETAYALMDVREGTMVDAGSTYGMYVGSQLIKLNENDCFPTGVVNVAGVLRVGANGFNVNYTSNKFIGLMIGGIASYGKPGVPTWCRGEVNVSKTGILSQKYGCLAIGIGSGEGELNFYGGTYYKTDKEGAAYTTWTLIGVGGGQGSLNIYDGGNVTISNSLYVGGIDMAYLGRDWTDYPDDSLAATGTVRVMDGVFTVTGDEAIFGAKGTGILEIGDAGVMTANNLVLSNNVESIVKFKLGADTGENGTINLEGKLTIASDVVLDVDALSFTGDAGRFPLISAKGGIEGEFDLEYRVAGKKHVFLRTTANEVSVTISEGLIIFVR